MTAPEHTSPYDASGVAVAYDALLLVSFGGPEGPDDVLPFLENVTRGRGIPRARLEQVGEHYHLFGGISPINGQNRALLAALRAELTASGPDLPVYWGNRNWGPYLADALREMRADGVRRALAFVTSAYSSYSGCRQYREDIAAAQAEVGAGAPQVDKLRHYFNHPGFLEPVADRVREALATLPAAARDGAPLLFSAHSVPVAQADGSGPRGGAYPAQLADAAATVAGLVGGQHPFEVVYQSRSGPPSQPWLEPDVVDRMRELHADGVPGVVVVPVGFVSDHMEVVYDLDTEAAAAARELGLPFARAGTVGTDPRFVAMVGELVRERTAPGQQRPILGRLGPSHDVCPLDCCPAPHGHRAAAAGTPADALAQPDAVTTA